MSCSTELKYHDPELVFLIVSVIPIAHRWQNSAESLLPYADMKEGTLLHSELYHPRLIRSLPKNVEMQMPEEELDGLDRAHLEQLAETRSGIYRDLIQGVPEVLKGCTLRTRMCILGDNLCSLRVHINLQGRFETAHLVALVNAVTEHNCALQFRNPIIGNRSLIDYLACFVNDLMLTPKVCELLESICMCTGEDWIRRAKSFDPYEVFTVISPARIEPHFDSADHYFKPAYLRELSAVAIRRVENYCSMSLESLRNYQINSALFDGEIVLLNYHNMLVCSRAGNGGLDLNEYISVVEQLKTHSAFLLHHNDIVSRIVDRAAARPARLIQIKRTIRTLEKARLRARREITSFRMLVGTTATRAGALLRRGVEVFRLESVAQELEHHLDEIDNLLAREYSTRLQKQLGWYSILLALLALLAATTGIIIQYLSPASNRL